MATSASRTECPSEATSGRFLDIRNPVAQILRASHADGDELFADAHAGIRAAADQRLHLRGDGVRVEPLLRGETGFDRDLDRIARNAQAIDHLGDALDLGDRAADILRSGSQRIRIHCRTI